MIAMSDAVILLVSATVLGSGIYRWQDNMQQPSPAALNNISVQGKPVVVSSNVQNLSPSIGAISQNNTVVRSQGTLMGKTVNTVAASSERQTVLVKDQSAVNAPGTNNDPVDQALYGLHTVESGDSLSMLSERFGTTVSELQSINDVNGTVINIGQDLYYPLPAN